MGASSSSESGGSIADTVKNRKTAITLPACSLNGDTLFVRRSEGHLPEVTEGQGKFVAYHDADSVESIVQGPAFSGSGSYGSSKHRKARQTLLVEAAPGNVDRGKYVYCVRSVGTGIMDAVESETSSRTSENTRGS